MGGMMGTTRAARPRDPSPTRPSQVLGIHLWAWVAVGAVPEGPSMPLNFPDARVPAHQPPGSSLVHSPHRTSVYPVTACPPKAAGAPAMGTGALQDGGLGAVWRVGARDKAGPSLGKDGAATGGAGSVGAVSVSPDHSPVQPPPWDAAPPPWAPEP